MREILLRIPLACIGFLDSLSRTSTLRGSVIDDDDGVSTGPGLNPRDGRDCQDYDPVATSLGTDRSPP